VNPGARAGVLVLAALATAAPATAEDTPAPPAGVAPASASVRVVVPIRPYLRRRAAHLSEATRAPDDRAKPWLEWEHATGDWAGWRPALHERGVIVELDYTGQLFANVHGGLTTSDATHAAGLVDLSLTLDTKRLGLWPGGTFFFLFEHQDGRGVSKEVGSFSSIGTLDEPETEFTHVAAWYAQQAWFEDRLVARIGKSDANEGFVDSELSDLYLNGDFAPPGNIPMPTYPDPAFGFALFGDPTDWLTLAAGAWGGDLDANEHGGAGLFDGRVFAIGELTLHGKPWSRPGHLSAGAWVRSVDTPDPSAPPGGRVFDRNYGAYALVDQVLTREAGDAAGDQGLGAWFQVSWAPDDRNPNDLWIGGGLVYTGPVPGRDADAAGFAVASQSLGFGGDGRSDPPPELVFEWFYSIQIAPWLALEPDIQYLVNPQANRRNAVVVGGQLSVTF
jgi:porin